MPDHDSIRKNKNISIFGSLLAKPYLWHLNRRTASGAFAVGLFCAWIPVPMQMLIAAAGAIFFKVNLPLSVALVWVSNPITMPPLFYFAYLLGAWVLDIPAKEFEFELSLEWLQLQMGTIMEPLVLGCLLMGFVSSILGYAIIRLLWRLQIVRHIKQREERR